MASLLDIFGFLAVVLRGLMLSFGALTIGGLVFCIGILRPLEQRHSDPFFSGSYASDFAAVNRSVCRWIMASAVGLLAVESFGCWQIQRF